MAQRNCRIRNLLQLFALALALAAPCLAQEIPVWEVFGGYAYQRSNVREYYLAAPNRYTSRNVNANLNGWDFAVTENMNRWFGGTFDLSGRYKATPLLGTTTHQQMHSILYGPRFSFRTPSVVPFVHILFGAAHTTAKVTPVGPHPADTSFAVAAGGGLDLKLQQKASVRLIQAEYFRANALGANQNNYRLAAGLILNLGKSK